jgi:phage tail-like protein
MATLRKQPYGQFNFLVDLGAGKTKGQRAGFQEVSGIEMEATGSDSRTGKNKEKGITKLPGINKTTDVTLKRGVIDSTALSQWLNDIRNGGQKAFRTVTTQMQNEDHTVAVVTWKLLRARIVKIVSGPFNAKGADVAMEELTLACERLEVG